MKVESILLFHIHIINLDKEKHLILTIGNLEKRAGKELDSLRIISRNQAIQNYLMGVENARKAATQKIVANMRLFTGCQLQKSVICMEWNAKVT